MDEFTTLGSFPHQNLKAISCCFTLHISHKALTAYVLCACTPTCLIKKIKNYYHISCFRLMSELNFEHIVASLISCKCAFWINKALFKCLKAQNIFCTKINLCTCSKCSANVFFLLPTNPPILYASKLAKTQASFVHNWVRRGVPLLLLWRHNLLYMHVYKELMQRKSVCDVKSVTDPLPFRFSCEQKILGFSQVFKPIRWQDLLEEEKCPQCASNRCKDSF